MTDVVYILGRGSIWSNNELRFSLRSVEKNLGGVGKVYVIGENPGWFTQNIIHIYYPDEVGPKNADGNMARKILRACREPDLSDNFLFMNDDFIIYKPVVASEIPWYDKGDMKDRPEKFWRTQFYRYRLRRTFDVLRSRGLPTMQYDYHAPMLMNKHEFPKVMAQFDYAADIGYTFRSLYGNMMNLPSIHLNGQKKTIYMKYDEKGLRKYVENCTFIGYNDLALNSAFKRFLEVTFPEPSKYEIEVIGDERTNVVKEWFENGCDYNKGVAIFEKFTVRNIRLIKYFQSRNDNLSKKRLKMTLQAWL